MASTPEEALRKFAESLGVSPSEADLARTLPLMARALKNALSREPLPDLGETEPAFGLRFDSGALPTRTATEE